LFEHSESTANARGGGRRDGSTRPAQRAIAGHSGRARLVIARLRGISLQSLILRVSARKDALSRRRVIMRCDYACGSPDHLMHRRKFLGLGLGGVVAGLGAFGRPAVAKALESNDRRVLVVNMAGGLSQLESWDPKPGTRTGGPFRAIPTSVPGIHIS